MAYASVCVAHNDMSHHTFTHTFRHAIAHKHTHTHTHTHTHSHTHKLTLKHTYTHKYTGVSYGTCKFVCVVHYCVCRTLVCVVHYCVCRTLLCVSYIIVCVVHYCVCRTLHTQVSAMALANLCVSYIMTSLNEKAEDLLRQVLYVIVFSYGGL